MGNWQGDDYSKVPIPDDLTECNTVQRRAYLYRRIEEEGHHSLIDPPHEARKLDISQRQVYYDLEAVAQYIEETIGENHVGENMTVFEKAKREALREGDWETAVEVLKGQAEWLENRGALDKEPEEHEITWREFMEDE